MPEVEGIFILLMTFAVGFAAGAVWYGAWGADKDRKHLEEELDRERAKNARITG